MRQCTPDCTHGRDNEPNWQLATGNWRQDERHGSSPTPGASWPPYKTRLPTRLHFLQAHYTTPHNRGCPAHSLHRHALGKEEHVGVRHKAINVGAPPCVSRPCQARRGRHEHRDMDVLPLHARGGGRRGGVGGLHRSSSSTARWHERRAAAAKATRQATCRNGWCCRCRCRCRFAWVHVHVHIPLTLFFARHGARDVCGTKGRGAETQHVG